MIINYEEIQNRAKVRAEKVRDAQEAAARVPDAIEMLDEALSFFENFGQLVKALDSEGKEMLGDVAVTAQVSGFRATDSRRNLFKEAHNLLQMAAEVAK